MLAVFREQTKVVCCAGFTSFALSPINAVPDAEVVGVFARTPERAQAFAKSIAFRWFDDPTGPFTMQARKPWMSASQTFFFIRPRWPPRKPPAHHHGKAAGHDAGRS
jgi:hypothetical protein